MIQSVQNRASDDANVSQQSMAMGLWIGRQMPGRIRNTRT